MRDAQFFKTRRAALAEWLIEPGGPPSVEHEALLKVAFADHGSLEGLRANWWDSSTNAGGERLCSPNGDIAVRFHLLLHGASGVLAASVAAVIYRWTDLFAWWPPEGRSTPNGSSDAAVRPGTG